MWLGQLSEDLCLTPDVIYDSMLNTHLRILAKLVRVHLIRMHAQTTTKNTTANNNSTNIFASRCRCIQNVGPCFQSACHLNPATFLAGLAPMFCALQSKSNNHCIIGVPVRNDEFIFAEQLNRNGSTCFCNRIFMVIILHLRIPFMGNCLQKMKGCPYLRNCTSNC